ncbi:MULTISPECIES: component of SufBCD complex [Shimia]|uniref:component of SufBCD complex n=1 Tax=Shimia TaxID=573139 RepID=UPI001FB390E7|nr:MULTISPECIES: component of SufBCD complex [Shimia]MDV4144153.1 component of SufBCD complex [Shimia sp. FJ5]
MNWHQLVFEVIDMRSFSNLWFWIALAVMWSSASHWVLGVPYDMVLRAKRAGGQTEIDLEDMVRINTNRLLYIGRVSGLWLLSFACFLLTGLAVTGFIFGIEFAQAVFLLLFPMSLVGMISLSTASRIQQEEASGELLRKRLTRHRLYVQLIGMASIFVTSLWGMYMNFHSSPFG